MVTSAPRGNFGPSHSPLLRCYSPRYELLQCRCMYTALWLVTLVSMNQFLLQLGQNFVGPFLKIKFFGYFPVALSSCFKLRVHLAALLVACKSVERIKIEVCYWMMVHEATLRKIPNNETKKKPTILFVERQKQ